MMGMSQGAELHSGGGGGTYIGIVRKCLFL